MPYFLEIENARSRMYEKVMDMHGLSVGKIRVAAFPSVYSHWMPQIIKGFHEVCPMIEIELMSGSYPMIETYVSSGAADCGFVHLPTAQPMKTWTLKNDPFYAILPKDHRLRGEKEIAIEQLAEEPFIMSDDLDENEVAEIFRSRGFTPLVLYTVPDPPTVGAMVREGLGISILTDLASEEFGDTVVRRPLAIDEKRQIGLTVGAHTSSAVRKFVDFVCDWAAEKNKKEDF